MALGVGAPHGAGCLLSSPVSVLVHIHSAQHTLSMPLFPKQTHRPAVCLVSSSFLWLEGARRSPAGDAARSFAVPRARATQLLLTPPSRGSNAPPRSHISACGVWHWECSSGCFGGCLQLNAKIGLSRSQLQAEQSCSLPLPGFASLNTCALKCTFFSISL